MDHSITKKLGVIVANTCLNLTLIRICTWLVKHGTSHNALSWSFHMRFSQKNGERFLTWQPQCEKQHQTESLHLRKVTQPLKNVSFEDVQ